MSFFDFTSADQLSSELTDFSSYGDLSSPVTPTTSSPVDNYFNAPADNLTSSPLSTIFGDASSFFTSDYIPFDTSRDYNSISVFPDLPDYSQVYNGSTVPDLEQHPDYSVYNIDQGSTPPPGSDLSGLPKLNDSANPFAGTFSNMLTTISKSPAALVGVAAIINSMYQAKQAKDFQEQMLARQEAYDSQLLERNQQFAKDQLLAQLNSRANLQNDQQDFQNSQKGGAVDTSGASSVFSK